MPNMVGESKINIILFWTVFITPKITKYPLIANGLSDFHGTISFLFESNVITHKNISKIELTHFTKMRFHAGDLNQANDELVYNLKFGTWLNLLAKHLT